MRPARVASLRRELLEWLDSTDAESYYEHMASDAGTWNREGQRTALADANLFYVSEEMAAVAVHAAQSMPDQVPLRAEFPAEAGFVAWDGPLVASEVVESLLEAHPQAKLISTTQVLSWTLRRLHYYEDASVESDGRQQTDSSATQGGQGDWGDRGDVVASSGKPLYDEPDSQDDSAESAERVRHEHEDGTLCDRPLVDVAFLTFWVRPEERTFPPLIPYHSAVFDLSLPIRESARVDNVGGHEAAGTWIEHFDMSVYTTLVLMGQTVASVSTESPDRAERRRSARDGIDVRDVRVVRLRRELHAEPDNEDSDFTGTDETDDGEAAVEWRRRWVVRGHWRQQWYPSLNAHRQVWIHSHVKGPEDRPLITGQTETVHALMK